MVHELNLGGRSMCWELLTKIKVQLCCFQIEELRLALNCIIIIIIIIYIFIWRQYAQGLRGADFKSSYYRQR